MGIKEAEEYHCKCLKPFRGEKKKNNNQPTTTPKNKMLMNEVKNKPFQKHDVTSVVCFMVIDGISLNYG